MSIKMSSSLLNLVKFLASLTSVAMSFTMYEKECPSSNFECPIFKFHSMSPCFCVMGQREVSYKPSQHYSLFYIVVSCSLLPPFYGK